MKYYDDVPIETNVLLGEDFDYREEFIGVAKKIVEKYENDEEKSGYCVDTKESSC